MRLTLNMLSGSQERWNKMVVFHFWVQYGTNTYGNVKLLCRQARLVPQIQGTPSATLLSRSNTIVTDAKDQYKKTLY